MTVPMDNLSAPSARELVQRLLNKNMELENGLRRAAKAKVPSDPNTWLQMRENYEAIILEDHEFSESHEIEYALWQLHYRRIEEFRLHINSASASLGSIASKGGKGGVRPDRIKKIRSVFKGFLSEATGFYHDLILKIRAKYGLPLGYFSEGSENQIILSKDVKKSAEMTKGLVSCHRCLIYLGDLARYKGLYGEGDYATRDYAAASSYYIQAASLWPSNGNPHHQLAILASYSGDELVAVYRYFQSLAVDSPFSTARDNLIIAFEKNRQSYFQLPRDAKVSSTKAVSGRTNGRLRGRGETRNLAKDVTVESSSVKERAFCIQEIYEAFCVRFVRLNGILFTRTSMETFGDIFSLVVGNLHDLLSFGPEEELNFGSDAAENGLFIVRLIAMLIFTVHNVSRESEGQSYADILQRSVLLQNAFTAAFEIVGHILKRCVQLQDLLSSYLSPAVLVFMEWLACHPDIATGVDVQDKQAAARSFFWTQCISFLNKLILSGVVSISGDEDETCFSDMSRYDEEETGNRLALWEDFELRGFSPLLPAQLILDFSRKHSYGTDAGSKEKRARAQRLLAAGRALMSVVRVDQQGVYFDPKLKIFAIGVEPKGSQDELITTDIPISNDIKHEVPVEKTKDARTMQSTKQLNMDGEEEDEEIVFKPTTAEKHADASAPNLTSVQVLKSVENSFKGDHASYSGAFSTSLSHPQLQASILNANPQLSMSFSTVIPQSLQHINSSTSKWSVEEQTSFADGLRNLSIAGNVVLAKAELQKDSGVSRPLSFPLPFSLSTNFESHGMFSGVTGVAATVIPSKFDSIMPFGINANDQIAKPPNLPTVSRKSPVSRPVRHFGPPPGFSPVPPKKSNDSVVGLALKNENQLVDDYSWLDGYQLPPTEGIDANNSLKHVNNVPSHVHGISNSTTVIVVGLILRVRHFVSEKGWSWIIYSGDGLAAAVSSVSTLADLSMLLSLYRSMDSDGSIAGLCLGTAGAELPRLEERDSRWWSGEQQKLIYRNYIKK
ncbi:hypothetical protein MRB53_017966 [Persea americana]|uniref:Uncharacterized protein n=1 Tax=Persea americana TaxID=3435 RepID=A0ACC2M6J7_PERAE|nr:hypothetical protein MRB53_017966 [Persea americana]